MRVDAPAGGTRPRLKRTGESTRAPRGVRVSLLGGFVVTADGTPRTLPKSGQRLVALLALNPRGLPRSTAARRLTPHLETASAGRACARRSPGCGPPACRCSKRTEPRCAWVPA